MAKFRQPKDPWHRVRLRSDGDIGELLLVGRGRSAYLWAGRDSGQCVTFSGRQTLRKLAKIILREIPERKK